MTDDTTPILDKIRALESELEAAFAKRRAGLKFGMENGKAAFEAEVLRRHRELKKRLWPYLRDAHPLIIVTAPVIYAAIVPFVFLDLAMTLYQAICFPAYQIPKVKRADYFIFDRHHLAYLNPLEKLNCAYCSYGNGLLAYAGEIAARTEQFWCPVKHARRAVAAHARYRDFAEYGDAEAYHAGVEALRLKMRAKPPTA